MFLRGVFTVLVLVGLFSTSTVFAADGMSVGEVPASSPQRSLFSASMNLGQSFFSDYLGVKNAEAGRGLTFGFRLMGWGIVGLGFETHQLKLSRGDSEYGRTLVIPSLVGNLLRFEQAGWGMTASLATGVMVGLPTRYKPEQNPFVGGSLDLSYQDKIGMRAEFKSSATVGSLSSLSLVGYY